MVKGFISIVFILFQLTDNGLRFFAASALPSSLETKFASPPNRLRKNGWHKQSNDPIAANAGSLFPNATDNRAPSPARSRPPNSLSHPHSCKPRSAQLCRKPSLRHDCASTNPKRWGGSPHFMTRWFRQSGFGNKKRAGIGIVLPGMNHLYDLPVFGLPIGGIKQAVFPHKLKECFIHSWVFFQSSCGKSACPSVCFRKQKIIWLTSVFGLSTLTQNRPSSCCLTDRFLPD